MYDSVIEKLKENRFTSLLGSAATVLLVILCLMISTSNVYFYLSQTNFLHDYGIFWSSGWAMRMGLDPYGFYPMMTNYRHEGFIVDNINLNPPPALLFSWIISGIQPWLGRYLWNAIDTLFIVATVSVLWSRYRAHMTPLKVLILVTSPMIYLSIGLTQIYGLIALLCTLTWLSLIDGRVGRAGLLLGLVITIKPLLLVWPALLFFAGYRRPALVAGGVFITANLATVLILGPEIYYRWFEVAGNQGIRILIPTNLSLSMPLAHFGVLPLATILAAVILPSLAFWAWRTRPGHEALASVAFIAAFLCSPISWLYYLIFALPVFFWLRWTPMMTIAILIFAIPPKIIASAIFGEINLPYIFGYTYQIGFFLLIIDLVRRLIIPQIKPTESILATT